MFKWLTGKPKKESSSVIGTAGTTPLKHPEPSQSKSTSEKKGGLSSLKSALSLTGKSLVGSLRGVFGDSGTALSDEKIDEIEETLLRADVGLDTAVQITDTLRKNKNRIQSPEALMDFMQEEFSQILRPYESANTLKYDPQALNIYIVVGVNGAGKTTFIGKLAHRFIQEGKKVVVGAGDTFRAAAEDQLAIWAERAGAELIRKDGADPSSVIFEAIESGKNSQANVVILDTAGRLQNKYNLMEELQKIRHVIDKAKPEHANVESLLVLDATTGQNALKQAEVFKEIMALSGVILTKLDGSAKGGMILSIAREYQLPVKMVGVGEGIGDLRDFNPNEFIDALFK